MVASDAFGRESVIETHQAGEFIGGLDLLDARIILVAARATTDVDVLRIPRSRFRAFTEAEQDIANLHNAGGDPSPRQALVNTWRGDAGLFPGHSSALQ